jgi:hypothetical protein
VIVEHCVSKTVNPKHTGQKLHLVANPATPMLKRLAGKSILAADKLAANTSLDRMQYLNYGTIATS